jgi:Fe-S-cluster containining protein
MKTHYDCLKCPGYCCSYGRIVVTERDIARLAKHFGIDVERARARFSYHYKTKEVDEWILRHRKDTIFDSMCRFFDQEKRRCTVYEARPAVCREYPDAPRCGYFEFLKFEREQQDDPDLVVSAR